MNQFLLEKIERLPLSFCRTSFWSQTWELPKLQAHRGHWIKSNRQNTLESLADAKKEKFCMAEIDVQLTKDGEVILFHDFDLKNICLKNVLISELNFKDLQKLIKVDSLEEVLLSTDRPEFLNIELKTKSWRNFSLEEKVISLLRKTGTMGNVLFSSFNHLSLLKLKNLEPEIPRAMLATGEKNNWNKVYLKYLYLAPLVEPQLIHIETTMANEEFVSFLKSKNLKISVWTENDLSMAKKFYQMGVDSIISDVLTPGLIDLV